MSRTTIHVENEKFKIEATKRTYSLIEVKGYHKEVPEPSWKVIEEEKNLNGRYDRQKRTDH
jgi:hypothetical protein